MVEVYRPHEQDNLIFFVDERMSFAEEIAVLEYREFKGKRVIVCTSVLE